MVWVAFFQKGHPNRVSVLRLSTDGQCFFIFVIKLFATLIEFKLSTLASFMLIIFSLFIKTTLMIKRLLRNVVPYGIKALVFAIIIDIDFTLFS